MDGFWTRRDGDGHQKQVGKQPKNNNEGAGQIVFVYQIGSLRRGCYYLQEIKWDLFLGNVNQYESL